MYNARPLPGAAHPALVYTYSKTGFRGVFWDSSKNRYKAEIGSRLNGTRKRLGNFHTAEEAAEAYDIAAIERYGDGAVLNFPLAHYLTVKTAYVLPLTHCVAGHRMDETNTYAAPDGGRHCRQCNRDAVRDYERRKRHGPNRPSALAAPIRGTG